MTIKATFVEKHEQVNGYWLVSYLLSESCELPINLVLFNNEQSLQIFSHKDQTVQFLTQDTQPPETLEWHLDSQTWLFLADFEAEFAQKDKTCIAVNELMLGSLFFLSQQLSDELKSKMVAILHSTEGFPFVIKPAQFMFENLPQQAAAMIGACPLLEDWNIPNRLCHDLGLPGCFDGNLQDLQNLWPLPENWQWLHLEAPSEA